MCTCVLEVDESSWLSILVGNDHVVNGSIWVPFSMLNIEISTIKFQ